MADGTSALRWMDPAHRECRVERDGVGLAEHPGVQFLEALV